MAGPNKPLHRTWLRRHAICSGESKCPAASAAPVSGTVVSSNLRGPKCHPWNRAACIPMSRRGVAAGLVQCDQTHR